jgi:pSer/pThr/pTyr-binding forkhead associated (FHA) protein
LIQQARTSREHPVETEAELHADVHCLELEDGELGPETFIVGSSGVKIGRMAPADIVLSHKSVSREHCMIGLANDELLVTDLNSTNGTYVDDERVERATIVPVGSVLRLGQISLKHAVRPLEDSGSLDNPGGSLQARRFAAAR